MPDLVIPNALHCDLYTRITSVYDNIRPSHVTARVTGEENIKLPFISLSFVHRTIHHLPTSTLQAERFDHKEPSRAISP